MGRHCPRPARRIDAATAVQARLDARIEVLIEPYRRRVALLATIPGLNPTTAPVILAEIGTDITLLPSAGHLASWAGICPGHHESAGKHNTGTIRPGDPWLMGVLRRAAISAARGKESYRGRDAISAFWDMAIANTDKIEFNLRDTFHCGNEEANVGTSSSPWAGIRSPPTS